MDTFDFTQPPAASGQPTGPSTGSSHSVGFSNPFHRYADQDLDLIEIIRILRRRKNVIFACIAIVMAISAAIIFQITPRYMAEASVMLEPRKTQVLDLQAVVSGLPVDSAVIRSEVEVLKSAPLAEQVAKKLKLVEFPEFNPRLQPPSIFAPLRAWISSQVKPILGIEGAKPNGDVDPAKTALVTAAHIVQADTEVVNDGRSYILKIRVESETARIAAAIANAYVDTYLDSQLEAKFEAVRRANTWLNDHLTDLRKQVEVSDKAVQLFKAQHNLLTEGKGGETITSQQIAELNSQLILASADSAQKESNLKQIEEQLRSGGIAAAAQVLASPLIQRLREQEADLLKQEAQLATKYKPAHPAMINIKAQIHDLDQKIQDEINKIVRAMAGEVAAARAKEASLRTSLQGLQKSSAVQDQTAVQLRELQRQADANRTLYENFLNRFKQTSAQEDIQQPDARLVSSAAVPGSPSYPRTQPLLAFAFMGSVVFGILAAFGVERLDNGFRTGEQLEKLAHVTPLGLIPDSKSSELPYDTVIKHPVSPYSEAIRTVRTALRYSNVDNPPKVVMVTSSLPDEGKSVFSLSLARSIAFSGGRAMLIDCDLRRPTMAELLNVDPKPGVLTLFENNADINGVIRVDKPSGMHFIPASPGTPNPQDILGSQQMRGLIEKLRPHYDLIVLDTPPVLAVSDALILSHAVDTTMFLVRWGRTPRPVVLGALKSFRLNGGTLGGVVLSRVDFSRQATYGHGDSGYYYGHYGKHYAHYAKSYRKS